jgi:hypothetical protein
MGTALNTRLKHTPHTHTTHLFTLRIDYYFAVSAQGMSVKKGRGSGIQPITRAARTVTGTLGLGVSVCLCARVSGGGVFIHFFVLFFSQE